MSVAGGLTVRAAIRVFGPFARPHWRALSAAVLLVVVTTGIGLLQPWPLKYLFDRVLIPQGRTSAVQLVLLLVVLAMVALAVLDGLAGYLQGYLLAGTGAKVAFGMRTALYEAIQRQSLTFHDQQQTGELLTRVTDDVEDVQELLTQDLVENGANLLTLVGMLAVMFALDWQLSLAMLVLLPVLYAANIHFRRRVKAVERAVRHSEGDLASIAQEAISSIRVVKAFGREQYETDRFTAQTEQALRANLRALRIDAAFSALMGLLTAVALAALVWLGAQRVLAGRLSPGDLLVFIAYLRDFYGPVRALSKLSAQISKASVRAGKIAEILDAESTVRDLPGAVPAPPLAGGVAFEAVTFGYLPDRPVLHEVSFTVPPGQVLALVGPTGAGKSTIAGMVARLYDPTSGRVTVDGTDVREYTLASLQGQVSFVLQTSLLFHASIRENIAYGRPSATFGDIVAAARVANAHDFVTGLPDGYDTVVGERGDTLSGGQRQRIAIARALVRDTPILILDEPTTGLDVRTEQGVLEALERLMAGRTTIVIAHDLSTVHRADQILVVNNGRLVERGTHAELLRVGGLYRELSALSGRRALPAG